MLSHFSESVLRSCNLGLQDPSPFLRSSDKFFYKLQQENFAIERNNRFRTHTLACIFRGRNKKVRILKVRTLKARIKMSKKFQVFQSWCVTLLQLCFHLDRFELGVVYKLVLIQLNKVFLTYLKKSRFNFSISNLTKRPRSYSLTQVRSEHKGATGLTIKMRDILSLMNDFNHITDI